MRETAYLYQQQRTNPPPPKKQTFFHRAGLFVAKGLFQLTRTLLIIGLPFFTLIRVSVFTYQSTNAPAFFCVLGGILSATLVLYCYVWAIDRRFRLKLATTKKQHYWKVGLILGLVCLYTGFGVWSFSSNHAKSTEVAGEFTQAHPILRLGVATVIWVDSDLLITDLARKPIDYTKMNLPVKSKSLHYKQTSGYTHAMDIRTRARFEIRNWAIEAYFDLMGFKTLRHIGNEDHLHVSLAPYEHPGSL